MVATPDAFDPLRMGLAPLGMDAWLKPRAGDGPVLAERARLVAESADAVLALTPAGEAPVGELANLFREHGFSLLEGAPRDLLAAFAVTVAEDMLLLTPAEDAYVLSAAVLCFPNRWRLADKIGRGLTSIHGPVPDYETALAGPVDRFLARLRPGRAFVRGNWGLSSSPVLHLPEPTPPVDPMADAGFYLREEEQSFVKLAGGAVVFAIRTAITPWEQVAEDIRTAIRDTAAGLSPAWRAYKSLK